MSLLLPTGSVRHGGQWEEIKNILIIPMPIFRLLQVATQKSFT
jgi:hypothetical protein